MQLGNIPIYREPGVFGATIRNPTELTPEQFGDEVARECSAKNSTSAKNCSIGVDGQMHCSRHEPGVVPDLVAGFLDHRFDQFPRPFSADRN